ncbi:MAG: thermonuclease family protein [Candidatus Omnitrophica bacterium]|nr:thermonuclease family protein [Candidatus Omnitrophota bacterium]
MKILFSLLVFFFASPVFSTELNPLLETSAKYGHIKVVRVLSVDTLLLENDEKVSLIGLIGPTPPKRDDVKRDKYGFIVPDEDPTTSLEVEAFRFVKGLVEGKDVRLEFDAERRDDFGMRTVYAFLPDGKMLNEEILRQGYAQLKLRMPNMRYADRFRKAYQEAHREMRGLQGQW